jgi:hypothetical protein
MSIATGLSLRLPWKGLRKPQHFPPVGNSGDARQCHAFDLNVAEADPQAAVG